MGKYGFDPCNARRLFSGKGDKVSQKDLWQNN